MGESNFAERFNPEPQSEEFSCSSDSVVARLCERATKTKGLERAMQHWCQKANPVIEDLESLAPYIFGLKCSEIDSCAVCNAVAELEACCESFLQCKVVHARAKEEHDEATKTLMMYGASKKGCMLFCVRKDGMMLEVLSGIVCDKAQAVIYKAEQVSKEARSIAISAALVLSAVVSVADRHSEAQSLLDAVKAAGNKTSLVTTTESQADSGTKNSQEARFHPEPHQRLSKFDALCKLQVVELDKLDFLPILEEKHIESLVPLYEYLKSVFGTASMLHVVDEKYASRIQKTVNGIIEWNVGDRKASSKEFFTPGCVAQEREGVQPILYAIMIKIARVLGVGQHITREQRVQKLENRAGRIVDFVVTPSVQEHVSVILAALLGVPIEIKPISRKNATFVKLLLEAQSQVVGQLAKRATFSFDLGGIGENCTFFGLELTMASITVIVLKLSGMGTADVEVTTQRTKRAPLFDEETSGNMFGEMANEVKATLENVEGHQGLPSGFCLLARTLMSQQCGLGTSLLKGGEGSRTSFSMRVNNAESCEARQYLGSGAFSHVWRLDIKDRNDVFVKMAQSHRMRRSLEREVEALTYLRRHDNIPKLFDVAHPIKDMDIKVRCATSTLPCLPLIGLVGLQTNHKCSWGSFELKVVFDKVYDAIQYAHDNGWAHLDVRPANIVFSVDPSGNGFEVMLIDWGCAHRTNRAVTGFFGCPPFAHDNVFGLTQGWTPSLDNDLASLVYSIVSLHCGCIPWSGFSNHLEVPVEILKRRSELSSRVLIPLLAAWDLSSEVKEKLLHAIGHQNE